METRKKKVQLSDESKDRIALQADLIARSWEPRFSQIAQQQFLVDLDEYERLLDLEPDDPNTLWQDWQFFQEEELVTHWRNAFVPLILGLALAQAAFLNQTFGLGIVASTLFTAAWAAEQAQILALQIKRTTRKTMRLLFQQARDEGWSLEELSTHVRQVFEQWALGEMSPGDFEWFTGIAPSERSGVISETESILIGGLAAIALYMAAGIQFEEWHTMLDERVCPWCNALHGMIQPVGEPWFGLGEMFNVVVDGETYSLAMDYREILSPPAHSRCRCFMLPVI